MELQTMELRDNGATDKGATRHCGCAPPIPACTYAFVPSRSYYVNVKQSVDWLLKLAVNQNVATKHPQKMKFLPVFAR